MWLRCCRTVPCYLVIAKSGCIYSSVHTLANFRSLSVYTCRYRLRVDICVVVSIVVVVHCVRWIITGLYSLDYSHTLLDLHDTRNTCVPFFCALRLDIGLSS